VLSSESLLVNVLKRAKQLAGLGNDIYATPALRFFLYNKIGKNDLMQEGDFTPSLIASHFNRLDDNDIMVSAKYWSDSSDKVLADLSERLINRNLFAIELQNEPFPSVRLAELRNLAGQKLKIAPELDSFYIYSGSISNLAYTPDAPEVTILLKNGDTADISSVSEMFDHRFLSERITKYFLCYPKECR
jgi:hypothetical protein